MRARDNDVSYVCRAASTLHSPLAMSAGRLARSTAPSSGADPHRPVNPRPELWSAAACPSGRKLQAATLTAFKETKPGADRRPACPHCVLPPLDVLELPLHPSTQTRRKDISRVAPPAPPSSLVVAADGGGVPAHAVQ